jgi:ATP-dependent DNA helicase RecQ
LTARQNGLLAALKATRIEIARKQKQPAFVIFHDSVLFEMALRCSGTSEELLKIPGVGPNKAARYGAIFLSTIADYNRE